MNTGTHHVSRNDGYGGVGVSLTPLSGPASSSVIFLHGLGDSGEGWAGALPHSKFRTTNFIFPTAPTRPISLNGGFAMPGWFDIKGLGEDDPEDKPGFVEAKTRIDSIIQGEIAKGIPAEKIVLGGFSQGGAVTLHTALRSNIKLGGAVILSGWLPLKADYPAAATEVGKSITYWAGHGDADGVVRYTWGKHSADKLKEMGVNYDFHTYSGLDHGATPEEMNEVIAFLQRVLG